MLTLYARPLRVLVALAVLACTACFGVPIPELSSFPIRSDSDCKMDVREALGSIDVAIAIDASRSTRFPAGVDVDGDGLTGTFTQSVVTDQGDTRLSAQVAAVRSLVQARPAGARFSIVSFTGRLKYPTHHAPAGIVTRSQAVIRADLTADLDVLEAGLRSVLRKGSFGNTNFAAGMSKALRTLEETPALSDRALRVILFMADSSDPMIVGVTGRYLRRDSRMKTAAKRAIDLGVRIHTFGLGAAALDEPPTTLTRIAGATGGSYTPVLDPNRLHCHLLKALHGSSPHRGPLAAHRASGKVHAGSRLALATTL